ncbi:MAG TPA: choice-of-anchor Q domain-containing protein, partial [Longimicrobiales bacterium]
SDDGTCGSVFEFTIADPVLGALADNGGPSMTHALLAGSPAINSGSNCTVTTDQRYAPRDSACDIGAYEFIDFTTVNLAAAASATADNKGWAVLSGSVQCSRDETFDLNVTLKQVQRTGRGTVDIHAHATTPVTCTTSPLPWSVALVSTDGPFNPGDATATVATMNTRKWVTPASITKSVKVAKARR